MPREDLSTGKTLPESKNDRSFQLPELSDFMAENRQGKDNQKKKVITKKINRRNAKEYAEALKLNPFADADESLFEEEYDIITSMFGQGKLLNIPVPYLQSGHGLLAAVAALGAFLKNSNNPLTNFPDEIRDFLAHGLIVAYGINLVLAIRAYMIAKEKNLPTTFWAIKTLLFGGIALYEVTESKPRPK